MAGARGDIIAGRSFVELYVKNNKFLKGLRDARQRLNQFGADMQSFGRQLVAISAVAIIPIAFASKTFADFDDAMRQVKAVTGATGEEFVRMTAHAKKLGATTSFTAVEVAALKAELGRAGFDPTQIDAMTASVLNLARATSTEAALASGIMAASIRQFGLEAGDAGRIADGLTAAANKSFNTVEQLGEALSYAGPVARDFNLSFEDTLAILGGLGNVGVQASNAGTTVRRLLTLTGAEAEKLQGIFGVSFMDAAGNARPLVDVLGEVNAATADLGTAARAQKFNEAFGLLGITGASALGRSVGDIRALAEEIKSAGGIAATTAAEMDGGLGGVFRRLMSATEGVAIAIGESLNGELSSLGDTGAAILGTITKLISENKEAVVTFAKWAVVVGGVGVSLMAIGLMATLAATSIGGLLAIVNGVVLGISLLGAVFGILTSPVTLVIAVIAGIGVALINMTGSMDTVVGSAMGLWKQITTAFAGIRQTVGNAMEGIYNALAAGDLQTAGAIAMKALQLVVLQGLEAIDGVFGSMFGDAVAKISGQIIGGDFAGAWSTVVTGMTSLWESFSNGIVTAFVKASKAVIQTWRATVDSLTNYILKKASEGGVFGAFLEQVSGVDVQAEVQRNESLKADEGVFRRSFENQIVGLEQDLDIAIKAGDTEAIDSINAGLDRAREGLEALNNGGKMPDIFEQVANGDFSDPATQAVADELNAALDALQAQSDENLDRAGVALDNAVGGQAAKEVERLQRELAELQKQAAENREKADAEPVADAAGAGAGGIGGAAGVASSGGGSASQATSSIQGLLAFGQGMSRDPMVKAVDEQTRVIKAANEKQHEKTDQLIDAVNNRLGMALV